MSTGYMDDARPRASSHPASWPANLLLASSAVIALLLLVGGTAYIKPGLIRASFWALLAGFSAVAFVFLSRAVRLLRRMHR